MKQFWIQVVALLIVAFTALILTFNSDFLSSLRSTGGGTPPSTSAPSQLKIGDTVINVEVADTQAKRQVGLGGRDQLASDSGMLFTFSDAGQHSFWMKNMHFGLDFIWILNNKVVDITQNVPPPAANTADSDLPIYQSNNAINEVLEVNSGFVTQHGIKVGDPVVVIGS